MIWHWSIRCLQHWVKQCTGVIPGQPLQWNEGCLTTRCHLRRPPVVIGLSVLTRSVIVWQCPNPHLHPIVAGAFQICFISMQPGQPTFLGPLLKCAFILWVTVILGALLRSSFEKPFSQALILLCFTDPPSFAHCISPPGIPLPYCGLLA